jgi:hypothetical protein
MKKTGIHSRGSMMIAVMLSAILSIAIFMACNEDEDALTLSVSVSKIEAAATGTNEEVAIKSNSAWTVTSSETWITVTPSGGSGDATIAVAVAANTTGSERTATIDIVINKDLSHRITVTQEANPAEDLLSVSPSTISATVAAGAYEITVTSNVEWTVASSESWATVSVAAGSNNGKITVNVAANEGDARTATITITAGTLEQKVKVSQAALPVPPFFTKAGNYVADAVPNLPGEISQYADFGVLAYKITVESAGKLTVTDKESPEYNIWFLLYDNESKIGSWEFIENKDGTLNKEITAGTYYVVGLLNYWYDDLAGKESTIEYDLEFIFRGNATAEPYSFSGSPSIKKVESFPYRNQGKVGHNCFDVHMYWGGSPAALVYELNIESTGTLTVNGDTDNPLYESNNLHIFLYTEAEYNNGTPTTNMTDDIDALTTEVTPGKYYVVVIRHDNISSDEIFRSLTYTVDIAFE